MFPRSPSSWRAKLALSCLIGFFGSALAAQQGETGTGSTEAQQRTVDRIVLKHGGVLEGRLTVDHPSYVEIDTGDGIVIGMDPADTLLIERAQQRTDEASATAAKARVERDQWSIIHDGFGTAIGWMHEVRRVETDGRVRLSQEWHFREDTSRTEWSVVELWDADGNPLSGVFHEHTHDVRGRPERRAERIIRATIEGDEMIVERRTPGATTRNSYEVDPNLAFPLGARETIVRDVSGDVGLRDFLIFDPAKDVFERRRYQLSGNRSIVAGSGRKQVRVLETHSETGVRIEWLDGAWQTVRREFAGPELVAIPATETEARDAVQAVRKVAPRSFQRDHSESVGLWLPNPSWRFTDEQVDGSVSAQCDRGGLVTVARLGHIGTETPAVEAADAVLRWLHQAHPTLQLQDRHEREIHSSMGSEIIGEIREPGPKDPGRQTILVRVFRIDGEWFGLCAQAPVDHFDELQSDLDWMLDRVEQRPTANPATPSAVAAPATGG
ncbi:MAG: hypothetical protein AAF196_07120 [Planctomycetota bacterium]